MKVAPIDKQFMTDRQGKPFCLYVGLVDAAHRSGLRSIDTEILQYPTDANAQTTITRAVARFVDAEGVEYRYTGIGDANPATTGRMIAPHAIRMAETRSKARALRDALNVTAAAIEELYQDDREEAPAPRQAPRPISPEVAGAIATARATAPGPHDAQKRAQTSATAPNDAITPNLAAPATAANYARLAALHGALAKWEQNAPAPPRDGLTVAQYRAIGEALTARGKAHATAADAERAARLQGQDPKDDIPF